MPADPSDPQRKLSDAVVLSVLVGVSCFLLGCRKEVQQAPPVSPMSEFAEPLNKLIDAFNNRPPDADRLDLVRSTEGIAAKIARQGERFPDGHLLNPGRGVLGARPGPDGQRRVFVIGRTDGHGARYLFEETEPGRWVIDWESAVGYCDTDWKEFAETTPAGSHIMRVVGSPDDYFGGEFEPGQGFLCIKLTDLHGRATIWGYARDDSEIGKHLAPRLANGGAVTATLALEFPTQTPGAPDARRDQVWIREIVSGSWFVE